MCDEWWFQRRAQDREASRRLWQEFEQTRPLTDREMTEEDVEVTLEKPETTRLTTKS